MKFNVSRACYAITSISPYLILGFCVLFGTFSSAETATERELRNENVQLQFRVEQLQAALANQNSCKSASPIMDPIVPTLLRKLSILSDALAVARYDSGERDMILPDSLLQAEVPGQYILLLAQSGSPLTDPLSIALEFGLQVSAIRYVYSDVLNGFAAKLSETDRARLEANPRITKIARDGYIFATQSSGSSEAPNSSETETNIIPQPTSPVDVYVFDSGIRAAHIALQGRVGTGFTSFRNGIGTEDCNGHGTHIAATIGGRVYGQTDQARLISVKVLDNANYGDVSTLIAGVEWVLKQPGDKRLVNMSLTRKALHPPTESLLDIAVTALIDAGIPVIVAA